MPSSASSGSSDGLPQRRPGRDDGLRHQPIQPAAAAAARRVPVGPWPRFVAVRDRADRAIHELIAERRAAGDAQGGDDVLSTLLLATHEDGAPMSDDEIRDELLTLLVAGHETTATELAWAFERLVRTPDVLRKLVAEIDAGRDEYVTATIRETLRRRPVLLIAQPRKVKQRFELGETLEPASPRGEAYLVQPTRTSTPSLRVQPRASSRRPRNYTGIPSAGGAGALPGAQLRDARMAIVLRSLLTRRAAGAGGGVEFARARAITVSPWRSAGPAGAPGADGRKWRGPGRRCLEDARRHARSSSPVAPRAHPSRRSGESARGCRAASARRSRSSPESSRR